MYLFGAIRMCRERIFAPPGVKENSTAGQRRLGDQVRSEREKRDQGGHFKMAKKSRG